MQTTKEQYIKVKQNGILNLKELSQEYGMTVEDLVNFHNKYCHIAELLTVSLAKYVEYVYLPINNYEKRQEKLLKNDELVFPSKPMKKQYGVILKFSPKNLQIHYKINIKHNQQIVELEKEKTYINNQGINKIIEQLFEKVEKSLYPLKLSVRENGSINTIENDKEITKRWKDDCFPKLKEYYQSETSDEVLEQLDVAFSNINKKEDLLERNLFYKLYFLPIYRNYPKFKINETLNIYFSGLDEHISYIVNYSLNDEYTRGNKIALRLEGVEEENLFEKSSEKGKIDLLYKLDKKSHEISSITGFIITIERNAEYKIEFQMFELKNS